MKRPHPGQLTLFPTLVDTQAAAVAASQVGGVMVTQSTIRKWAYRGKIAAYGKDKQGRTLYNLREVELVATRRR